MNYQIAIVVNEPNIWMTRIENITNVFEEHRIIEIIRGSDEAYINSKHSVE